MMCRVLFFHATILLFSASLTSSALSFETIKIESTGLELGFGYRSDRLDWSISGDTNGENPNILSELTWDDIEIFQLQATGWLELGELPLLKRNSMVLANISFGKIFSGDVRDSDYAADDRNAEWSRSVSAADQGMTADFSVAIGPIFYLHENAGILLTPLLGYGFNMQALTMSGGEQLVSDADIYSQYFGIGAESPHELGKISGLDSSYTAYWYGPWLGANVDYHASEKLKMTVGVEYHWIDYFAQADWNLRTAFVHPVSFEHEASGTGVVWNLKGLYLINDKWSWVFSGHLQNWETEYGTDRTFFVDGTVGKTCLNSVHWDSYALTTGVQYRF